MGVLLICCTLVCSSPSHLLYGEKGLKVVLSSKIYILGKTTVLTYYAFNYNLACQPVKHLTFCKDKSRYSILCKITIINSVDISYVRKSFQEHLHNTQTAPLVSKGKTSSKTVLNSLVPYTCICTYL